MVFCEFFNKPDLSKKVYEKFNFSSKFSLPLDPVINADVPRSKKQGYVGLSLALKAKQFIIAKVGETEGSNFEIFGLLFFRFLSKPKLPRFLAETNSVLQALLTTFSFLGTMILRSLRTFFLFFEVF